MAVRDGGVCVCVCVCCCVVVVFMFIFKLSMSNGVPNKLPTFRPKAWNFFAVIPEA